MHTRQALSFGTPTSTIVKPLSQNLPFRLCVRCTHQQSRHFENRRRSWPKPKVSLPCQVIAIICTSFAYYLIPGDERKREELRRAMVEYFVRSCTFEKQAGYVERAVALFQVCFSYTSCSSIETLIDRIMQAILEFNFFCPPHLKDHNTKLKFLEAFWDSESPRLGEEVRGSCIFPVSVFLSILLIRAQLAGRVGLRT